MIDAIINEKSLPTILVIEAMEMLILAWDDVSTTPVQNCFKKASFFNEENDNDPGDSFFYLKIFHRTASVSR